MNEFVKGLKTQKKILLIDDNSLNLKILRENISELGMIPIEALNGTKGIELAHSEKPDLILLDIMMPIINGFEVCERLKADPETKDIPIIFLTAKTEAEDIINGFRLGAVDYINKPFLHPSELVARITTHLKLKEFSDNVVIQNEVLNQLIKEKNYFLSIAAHDLKNPIYSIAMIAKTILNTPEMDREEINSFVGEIKDISNKMLELILAVLDINALEEGRKSTKPEDLDLNEMIMIMLRLYEERGKAKQIKLHYDNQLEDTIIHTDRMALNQSIDNIISNAIKYSPYNKNVFITITGNEDIVRIAIRDEGPGISDEDKTRMFGKFVKLTALPTGDESSTGLGLSIVKSYIESISGTVWCESTLGEGATFIIEIPRYFGPTEDSNLA